jgi:UDP-2,3-diacylglucosamine pyrophosphatase LpxH
MDPAKIVPTTLVISDLHITTGEPPDAERPLWKRYKQADLFVDERIGRMLRAARAEATGPIELVLDGDIFDFDAVTELPRDGRFRMSWLERIRGLAPTEARSTWKLNRILDDHPGLVAALRDHVMAGNSVIFVVGNHDMELLWPGVQAALRKRLDLGPDHARVVFCEWFYISSGDTLIEHGNQYDAYCLCADPISPTIRFGPDDLRIRLPFGNHASRTMINGMGLINPHADSNWIMPFWGHVMFFWNYVARSQPFLPWTWLWTSVVTLWLSVRDGLEPAEVDPLSLDDRVEDVAARANGTPRTVRGLFALRVHPAWYQPWRIARELWLDRAFLFLLIVLGSFQVLATAKVFVVIEIWWWLALVALLFPPFLFYARSVSSEALDFDRAVARRIHLLSAVSGTSRVVFGHTHREVHTRMGDVEVLNAGTWSPAFEDPTCRKRVGRTCVVWIQPGPDGQRVASLRAWTDPGWALIEEAAPIDIRALVPPPASLVPPWRPPSR